MLLKEGHHKPARFFVWFNEKFDQLTRGYVRGVAFLNRRVGVAFAIIAVLILSIYGLFLKVPGELVRTKIRATSSPPSCCRMPPR